MKIIDARLRPPYKSVAAASCFSPGFLPGFNASYGKSQPESDKTKSMDLLLKEMEEVNIVKAIFPFRYKQGHMMNNDDFIDLAKEYPDIFYGMAGLNPLKGVAETIEDIDKYVINGPFTGVNFEPALDNISWKLSDTRFFPIFEKCEKENIPVYMTWGGLAVPPNFYDPQYPWELAKAFPKMKICLAHAGWPRAAEHCVVALNCRNVFLNVDLYVVDAPGQQDYITAANLRLKDQIMFGSAYPFMCVKEAVDHYLNKIDFRPEVLENIMYNNSARYLGIE